ncbi:Non-specific lipid-transfer protein 1 [Capsicum baccatum]|uniref:Non-specific lipid-transfer protein n=1 Tax=Capsicum baccatum TaxID=33114 RepID=A0A2G2VSR5_CAPBA|nr:Non-specific lipid-transfer protein 1 [Capsicum baccatum]
MEMVSKIACLVVLCMVVAAPHAEALTCGQVAGDLAACLPYLQGQGPLGGCCGGVKGLLGAAKTPADRKTACTCLKSAANAIKGINLSKAAGLPAACGVNIPYKISPSTDCSTGCVASVDCQCFFFLEVFNQAEVVSDENEMAELLRTGKSSKIDLKYNANQMFDECPQWFKSKVLVELHSISNTTTMETVIVNSHHVLVIEDTIPKLMGCNDLSNASSIPTHLESSPWLISIEVLIFKNTVHKLDMKLGDKLFDMKLERDNFVEVYGPHTTFGLPHALGLYIYYWVDTGQVFWDFLDRVNSVAMKSGDWDENESTVIETEGAEVSEPRDKPSEDVCLTEKYSVGNDGIIVEAWENTTKIVSIEATIEQSENTKPEQNIDVEASSKFLTPSQNQNMTEMKVIMSTIKIKIPGNGILEIAIFREMRSGIRQLTAAISLCFYLRESYAIITRARFEEFCMSMLFKSMGPVGKCLNEAMDYLDEKKLYPSINLDDDTTCGAAVIDTILIGNGDENIQELLVVNVTLLKLDVEAVGRTIIVLISRSATISAKEEQIFPTYSDHQLENAPIEELIRLNYCNWHWQFWGCSVYITKLR